MDPDLPSVDPKRPKNDTGFNFDEFLFNFRKPLVTILGGLVLIGVGVIVFKSSSFLDSSKVEVLESNDNKGRTPMSLSNTKGLEANSDLVVEISGAVQSPGVYKLKNGSRVDDLLIVSGGVSGAADREWVERNINRAAKLTDGQKLYVPEIGEKLETKSKISNVESVGNVAGLTRSDLVNINTASQKELEELPGIGPVYAQSIIEKRIYSSVEELLSKGALKKSVYEKLKDRVTVN